MFFSDPDGYEVEIWYELPTPVDPHKLALAHQRQSARRSTNAAELTDGALARSDPKRRGEGGCRCSEVECPVGSSRGRATWRSPSGRWHGLGVHTRGDALPPVVRDVIGDALWAAMVVWLIAAIAPVSRLPWRAGMALALCFAVEFSQSDMCPCSTRSVGRLWDTWCSGAALNPAILPYAAGVLVAVLLERATEHRHSDKRAGIVHEPWSNRPCTRRRRIGTLRLPAENAYRAAGIRSDSSPTATA